MRILFFNHQFLPSTNEADDITHRLLSEFAKNPEIHADLVTFSIDGKERVLKMGGNITIHEIPNKNKNSDSNSGILKQGWQMYKYAKKLAKMNSYDLIHSFSLVPFGFACRRLGKKINVPFIISLRASDVIANQARPGFLHNTVAKKIIEAWESASFIVASSQWLASVELKSKPLRKISIIYNGVDTKYFSPNPDKKKADDVFTVVCSLPFESENGIRFLIQAFNILIRRYENLRLVIMGDGRERASLEQLAMGLNLDKKVIFTGIIPQEKMLEYYQSASIFVSPSLRENFEKSIVEALACGLPVVATDVGAAREFVEDTENGFIVEPRNSYQMAENIEKFLLDSKLAEKMGEKSREFSEKIDWERVAGKYFDLYKKTADVSRIEKEE
ncbi:MAG TPA: glycosyltransferase [Candidatus Moranbacteria bacterium]|nr:glycosyltransferase [Candidatus Moranbacteria bacterium]